MDSSESSKPDVADKGRGKPCRLEKDRERESAGGKFPMRLPF